MNEWHNLARQVRDGDATAAAELRRKLEVQVPRIVRRTIRLRTADSALARQILADAERVAHTDSRAEPGALGLVGRVARRMCAALLANLRAAAASPGPKETVQMP